MLAALGLLVRVGAVTLAVVGIQYFLRVKPTKTPMGHTTEQLIVAAVVCSTYGWEYLAKTTGYSVTELMLLCTIIISGGNYIYYYQRVYSNETNQDLVEEAQLPHS